MEDAALARVPGIAAVELDGATFTLRGQGDDFVSDVIHAIADAAIRIRDFRTVIPSLEDVFLKLTGRSLRD